MGKTSLRASIIAAVLFLIAGAAESAGLGKLTVLSHLGEPLRAEIDVVAPEKSELETLSVRLGSPDAYSQSNLPYPPVALGLRMALDKRSSGETYIKVTTAQPVAEPFVDLLVELNWQGGKILRAYTALLDPPAFAAAPPPTQPPAPTPEAAPASPPPPPQPAVETRMGSEMQLPPAETPPAEVAAAPAPTETAPGEPLPAQPAPPAEQMTQAPPAEAGMPPKPALAPKEDSYGPVKYGDTLSKIARQYKPDDVSLDQMLVLLFRNNKDAFSGNNMNRLKTGKLLTIPDPSEAAGIPQKEARKQVHLQVADFNAYRERLASAAGATTPTPEQQAAGGKVTGPVPEKGLPPPGEPKEVLKLSKGEPPVGGGGKATQERVRGLEEEVAARDKTIREANERIAKLEKTVKDMQGLLELKNKPMAELQKPAITPPQVPAAPPKMAPAPGTPAAGPKPEAAPIVPPPPPVTPPAAPAGPMAASGTQPSVAATEPKPRPKPRAVAPPPPPPSMLDELLEEPTYLIGGGVVVALILGFFGYRIMRNRRGAADIGGLAEKKTSDVSAFAESGGDSSDATAAPRTSTTPPQIAEEVDPLAEAEIYLAYGRDGQAEEILKEALQNQPRRPEIHVKLLEIFAKRKDLAAFDPVARELQQVTGGQGELWLQAARLGYQLEPSNPRYAAGKPSAAAVAAAATAAAAAAAPTTDKTLDFQIDSLEPSPEIGTLTDIDAGFGRRFATTAAASATATADRLDLNVSLDDGQTPGTKTDIDLGKLSAAVNAATPVDLDLDSLGRPTDMNLATFSADQTSQMPVMDFNLDLPADGEDKTQAQMAKVDSVDFDLKFDDTATAGAGATSVDFDIDRISLETGGGKAEPVLDLGRSTPAIPDLDLSSINLDLGGSGPQQAEVGGKDDKWYDVQTKFDLAKAYQEMGDKEGAKEILREVVAEGDADQKAAAQKVLQALS